MLNIFRSLVRYFLFQSVVITFKFKSLSEFFNVDESLRFQIFLLRAT